MFSGIIGKILSEKRKLYERTNIDHNGSRNGIPLRWTQADGSITDKGEIILDFSLYDAMLAGFKKVIFVIKEEMEGDFRALIDERAGRFLQVDYAFQKLDDLPECFQVPEGREKSIPFRWRMPLRP